MIISRRSGGKTRRVNPSAGPFYTRRTVQTEQRGHWRQLFVFTLEFLQNLWLSLFIGFFLYFQRSYANATLQEKKSFCSCIQWGEMLTLIWVVDWKYLLF
jgi:hypothetical protein